MRFLHKKFNEWSVLVPKITTNFCFTWNNYSRASKLSPPMLKSYRKTGRAIILKVKEPRICTRHKKKCPIPGHLIVIVVICLRMKLYRKALFIKTVLPVVGAKNFLDDTF